MPGVLRVPHHVLGRMKADDGWRWGVGAVAPSAVLVAQLGIHPRDLPLSAHGPGSWPHFT